MLRALVLSDEFWSPVSRWKLIKSPVHLAVGSCRQLKMTDPPVAAISSWLGAAGQRILDAPNFGGDGWPGQTAWLNPSERLAARYELGVALSGGTSRWGLNPAAQSVGAGRMALPKSVADSSARALLERLDPAPGIDAGQLEASVSTLGTEARSQQIIRRVLASPEYQIA